jgi:bHLH factor
MVDSANAGAQSELKITQQQLAEEHARSMRYETSWREAEDRAASSQFELERVKAELDELKARQ